MTSAPWQARRDGAAGGPLQAHPDGGTPFARVAIRAAALLVGAALCLPCLAAAPPAASFDNDFAVIFADGAALPVRAELAAGIGRLAGAGARGVVLKFFIDRPGNERDDRLLAHAIGRLPTLLQARLDDAEPQPNPLPPRFTLPMPAHTAVGGMSGWLPLPRFAARAAGIGFVDFHTGEVPMLETYRAQTVKSLLLAAVELAAGSSAAIEPGRCIAVGRHTFPLDGRNTSKAPDYRHTALRTLSYQALLQGTLPASAIRDKVVILGYDGPGIPRFPLPGGSGGTGTDTIGAHRLFATILKAMYDAKSSPPPAADGGKMRPSQQQPCHSP